MENKGKVGHNFYLEMSYELKWRQLKAKGIKMIDLIRKAIDEALNKKS